VRRVLITGSRDWTDRPTIERALSDVRDLWGTDVVLVSGACPDGADRLCEEVAESLGWTVDRYHAEWDRLGKGAGFIRNEQMVRDGADMCLAFIRPCQKHRTANHGSHGATHTAELAEAAGINTWRFTVARGNAAVPRA
jgi:hypothetical protein